MRCLVATCGAVFLVVAMAGAAVAGEEGPTKISFKVKNLDKPEEADALKKALTAVAGAQSVDVVAAAGTVEITVKDKAAVKLSDIRAAVKKSGEELSVEEADIVIVGRIQLSTKAKKALEAIKKVEGVEKCDPTKGKAECYDVTGKAPKGVKLGDISKALEKNMEKRKDDEPVIADVVWSSGDDKKKKGEDDG